MSPVNRKIKITCTDQYNSAKELKRNGGQRTVDDADKITVNDPETDKNFTTTIGDFKSNSKYNRYGSPEDRERLAQSAQWFDLAGNLIGKNLPIASRSKDYTNRLMAAYTLCRPRRGWPHGARPSLIDFAGS